MQEQVHFEHETLGCLSSKSGEAVHFFWPGASASGALVQAGGGIDVRCATKYTLIGRFQEYVGLMILGKAYMPRVEC